MPVRMSELWYLRSLFTRRVRGVGSGRDSIWVCGLVPLGQYPPNAREHPHIILASPTLSSPRPLPPLTCAACPSQVPFCSCLLCVPSVRSPPSVLLPPSTAVTFGVCAYLLFNHTATARAHAFRSDTSDDNVPRPPSRIHFGSGCLGCRMV